MTRIRFHFLLAIISASWISCLYRSNAFTITLALSLPLLTLTLKNRRQTFLALLFSFLFLGYALIGYSQLLRQERQTIQNRKIRLLVYPDQLHLNEHGFIRGQGQNQLGQRFLFGYQAKSQVDVNRFSNQTRSIILDGVANQKPVMAATNDYQFDFHAYWKSQGITQQLDFQQLNVQEVHTKQPWRFFLLHCHHMHARAQQWAKKLPQPLGDYSAALLLGSKDSQLYENNPKIAELGLIHLFALSGLHVSFLANWFGQCTRRLRITREISDGLLAVLLIYFYLFTGSLAVLFRALVAGELRIINRNFSLQLHPVLIWSWSLMATLLFYPQVLLTLGGQLSFLLTLAVITTKNMNYWIRGFFLSFVSFPIILSQQYGWNVWQTLANLLVVPLFSTVVLPATLIGYFFSWQPLIQSFTNGLILVFDRLIFLVGQLPGYVVIGAFSWPVLLILLLIPWFLFRVSQKVRMILVSTWLFCFSVNYAFIHWPSKGEWTTFDIGQGDAAVLIEPGHRSVTVIDTGGKVVFGPLPMYDIGKQNGKQKKLEQKRLKEQEGQARAVIIPYLHARGIAKIDTIALSHQDQDHIGDARLLLENFKVKQVVMPAGMADLPAYKKKIKPYLNKAKVVEATDETMVKNCPLIIRYPFSAGSAGNDDSLAWTGRIGGQEIYTAGDLDRSGEQKILSKYPDLAPTIVKFGHHGSKTATDPAVYSRWQPRIGLVSAGRDSRYGHPHKEVLDVARNEGMIVYSTQEQGMLRYVYQKNHGYFEVTRHDITKSKGTN